MSRAIASLPGSETGVLPKRGATPTHGRALGGWAVIGNDHSIALLGSGCELNCQRQIPCNQGIISEFPLKRWKLGPVLIGIWRNLKALTHCTHLANREFPSHEQGFCGLQQGSLPRGDAAPNRHVDQRRSPAPAVAVGCWADKEPYHPRISEIFGMGTLARFAGAGYINARHTFCDVSRDRSDRVRHPPSLAFHFGEQPSLGKTVLTAGMLMGCVLLRVLACPGRLLAKGNDRNVRST